MNDHKEKQEIQELIDLVRDARATLGDLHPAEIADLLGSLAGADREELWELIDPEVEGEVLSYAQDSVRTPLLEDMDPQQVAAATLGLDTDDAADILQDLPVSVADQVLLSMDEQDRQRVAAVLSFAEDTAGGLMNTDTIGVRADVDIDVVLRYLRRRGTLPERTDSLFVVDRGNSYLGALDLGAVLTAGADRTVEEMMDSTVAGISADTSAREVAMTFERLDLLSAAVIDDAGLLLGRITVDDVIDVIRAESEHSLMGLAGLSEEDDMFAPVLISAKRRAVWLAVNLATAFLAAWVIGRFEATIEQIVALAILMPVVASMGGIAGSQTLMIMIRGLAVGQVGPANARSLLRKELAVAALNSLLWATVVALVATAWFRDYRLGIVIALAMIVNLLTAALAGSLIPLALRRMDIDPALAGGVVLTTVTDVIGFVAFLGIATLCLL